MRFLFSAILCCAAQLAIAITPTVDVVDGRQTLFVDGEPYYIKGMTFGKHIDKSVIDEDFKTLRELGVNTIRTWGTGDESELLFDTAEKYGIKVMAGIWLRHGRPGAEGDDSFNWVSDRDGMQAQWDGAIETVRKYKDHPAILCWGIGNEVFLNCGTEKEKVAYAKFLGRLCKEIKRIDDEHFISSSCAWTIGWPYWEEYCPDIDIYGVNTYGPGAGALPGEVKRMNITKPYVLTEFGARGEWDAPKDKNGLRKEPTDQEKWDTFSKGWNEWVASKEECVGGFVFNYGNTDNFNHAAIWLNLKVQGCYRPQYWATRLAFTGKQPDHAFPSIAAMSLPRDMGQAGEWIDCKLLIEDADSDEFDVSFYYNQRLDGAPRDKRDGVYPLEFEGTLKKGFKFKVPNESGLIKVYAFAKDDTDNLAIAFRSFVVSDEDPSVGVGKPGEEARLPFYVYKDDRSGDNHYGATGYMGSDMGKVDVDFDCRKDPQDGRHCIKFEYNDEGGWFGLAWQDPFNDWGKQYGGYDLRGATKLTLWARTDDEGVKAKFGFGMITRDEEWFDTATGSTGDQVLTKEWRKFEIDLTGMDLTRIKTGFHVFVGGIGQPYTFYIDNVRYE